MIDYDIVPLEKEYINDVYEINRLSLKSAWSLDSIEKELHNLFAKYVLIKHKNKIIGFAGIWIIVDEGHITNIAVHPEFRGIGLGNILMDELIKLCLRNNINAITLEVRKSNIVAQNLYKKFGFVEEGIRKKYYQDNEDAIIMWRINSINI
ncbi:protease synthase and sporulation negative regulatory protein PAI 1 [Clostridium tepidiprofundi DSM 19306]|uniref:[Ribosomal protein bS18]-alanine N-acetyltransferase n=1 Tax=Clostridium tepidiprofundi DSM 19306 TaxID=1121338 RepID=A0A151AXQ8_9CLOT|nr:ribosomal protein S18-alanine N-acetyltransferase [Clostridium tepidiprofundi]KYH32426.1 protease synthase and sporulation negative regulatory protein PAI 1 [Clostridium tepidiprofundi DSM 19306]